MYIKTMLAAATLVVVAASPALAQTHRTQATQNHVRAVDAYASAPQNVRPRSNARSNAVYDIRGHYVGSDPDATVRDQLARDPTQGD